MAPAFAARPLLDQHQWDRYFAVFARDANVPWKPTTVRLDTYSGAPVDFAIYNVDPADVIVAGADRAARPLDTSHRKPLRRWRFSPPPRYGFQASDVPVPLGSQEGFYVVEARRGDAVQQVWLNRTHIGLLAQDSPEGVVFWGVDLRTGRPIAHLQLSLLVPVPRATLGNRRVPGRRGARLIDRRTDGDGVLVWRERERPTFALAQHGAGRAFLSILPQPPPPRAIVALRLDSASVRAGERVRFVGFARTRTGGVYRRASGDAHITIAGHGSTLATAQARLDAAGAFSGEIAIPSGAVAGEYAVLANAAGGVGGTNVHVDAAGDVQLAISSSCPCDPARDVPISIVARRADVPAPDAPVHVTVVRSPHIAPPGASGDEGRWGTTTIEDRTVRTGPDGLAHVVLPSPSDGLDSTYGIRASAGGATATAWLPVPNAAVALSLQATQGTIDVGVPAAFNVRGFDPADGTAAAGLSVHVRLSHGATVAQRNVTLDDHGRARVLFARPTLGSNLALAQADVGGRTALDATSVLVEPRALSGRIASAVPAVAVTLDRTQYRPGDRLNVHAEEPASHGAALLALTGVRTYALRVGSLFRGSAAATFKLGDPQGDVRIIAAAVRDGAIAFGSADVALDAPGHAVQTGLALDRQSYAPGDVAQVTIRGGDAPSGATLAVRVADGTTNGAAYFGDAAAVLATGATTLQTPSSADPQWHAYVAPLRSNASDIFAAERPRKVADEVPTFGAGAARTVYWRVERGTGTLFDLPVPAQPGRYVVSILRIADDGDVGAASGGFTVR
ncbi:MAG: hypothetical protein GIX03_00455 [Candidatus Eremiobacteraeota bacterium]|nr:hypothetical protein [Candidatus Eremiobacteraeota bacterium]MBC5801493.1 hypothetical protein [Candidatus Eremiobacteraeota bacterium]MBC5822214.1 hypothetical protein [Candidatus Eremiobacteraeota bacterium]